MKKILLFIVLLTSMQAIAQKQVFIPTEFSTDPTLSTWSYSRSAQSENFVLFWGSVVGTDPSVYANADLRFTPSVVLDTLEKIYTKYIKEIHFCSDAPSTNLGKYKLIIVMNDTWLSGGPTGWAFGGSYDDKIGAMWVHPNATRDGGVTSHELTHSLQAQNRIDKNTAGGFNVESTGFFWETHANFMRTQMYPSFVKDDMPRWLATSSYHWSSTRHHYDAFNLLYTIQQQDSLGMVNRLWQESQANEHPLMTYKRLKGWNQDQLNDFIYGYAKRQVTADYTVNGAGAIIRAERKRLAINEPHYLWREYTLLKQIDSAAGRYIVPDELAPQDYGYNIIPLYTTCASRNVQVKFKGHTEVNTTAGWRYGFVAVKGDDSTVRYSPLYSANESEISFEMNADETKLYLVIAGSPTTHTTYVWEAGFPKIKRFSYELTIQNALPEGYQTDFRTAYKTNGHIHANGGGWVSNASSVAATVYVGPHAIVQPGCTITGNVRIEGNAWVEGATIKDNVIISGNANVYFGTYSNNVTITDNAVVNYCTVSGNVIIKGNALEWGPTFGGTVTIGGDAEIGDCSTSGVYLQTPHPNNARGDCDGKDVNDPSNLDINTPVTLFTTAQMAISNPVICTPVVRVDNLALTATATTSYVSPWENLAAVNDGYVPSNSNDKSNGAYGNWPNPDSLQWVQYDWPHSYSINKVEIYWFDDGGGVLVPTTAYMEYWNGTAWVSLGNVPLIKDAFNAIDINNVITSRIRVSMKNSNQSTGIIEWRVWGGPVPVKLISFTGERKDNMNVLHWEVDNVGNLSRFEIEYSANGTYFTTAGSVSVTANSGGVNQYQFNHAGNNTISYYRLKQIDKDGSYVYSPVLTIRKNNSLNYIRVCPNPVANNIVLTADILSSFKGSIIVFDMAGKKIIEKASVNFMQGVSAISLPVSNLSAGVYFINIVSDKALQKNVVLSFVKK